jgi:hypothetical protein
MDSSLQRVVLGDAPNFDEVTHWEVQEPMSWDNNAVQFRVFEGALADYRSSYIYVFDKNGEANQVGVPVCDTCKAPPEKIELQLLQ